MSESEFYGSPVVVPDLGDPATDPLMTVRMEPPDTWARRYGGNTVRVSRQHTGDRGWREIGREDGRRYSNGEVRGWPVQHPLVWGVAYDRLAGKVPPPPAGKASTAPDLEGDMGVESFRGGES